MGQLSVSRPGQEWRYQSHGPYFQELDRMGRERQHHDAIFGRSSRVKARERGYGRIRRSLGTSAGNPSGWSHGRSSFSQELPVDWAQGSGIEKLSASSFR